MSMKRHKHGKITSDIAVKTNAKIDNVDISVHSESGEQHNISAGLAADRPAAGVAKRYYFSTDTIPPVWSRDDGTAWVDLSGGVADHGLLIGLADDDHTQYGALAQAEVITGLWTAPAPTAADGLARKAEVDDAFIWSIIFGG